MNPIDFRILGLPAETFAPLFALDDAALAARGARRRIAEAPLPCRVSLTDCAPGDTLLLLNHEHHAVDSPYRMRFAIFVRAGETRFDAVNLVPEQLRRHMLAVRGFDAEGMMRGWTLADGRDLEPAIAGLLASPATAYLHVHFAAPGCYAARVERA